MFHAACSRALTALALTVTTVCNASALDLRGFRGLWWGDELERLGDARQVSAQGSQVCYQRTNENLLFGDIELRALLFCFDNGRFTSVRIDANARLEQLGAEFQATYGVPDSERNGHPVWGKPSEKTHARLSTDPDNPTRGRLDIWHGAQAPR